MSLKSWKPALIAPVLGALLYPSAALAVSGTIVGTQKFYNLNGNFCPKSEACTGATYPEALFSAYIPIPEAKIQIRRSSDDLLIGVGQTTGAGVFLLTWEVAGGPSTFNAYLHVLFEHKDDRFFVHSYDDHIQYATTSADFLVTANQTTVMNANWGTPASPNEIAQVYWAAWKVWEHRLSTSNLQLAYFNDVDIVAFDDDSLCRTSCARPWYGLMTSPPSWAESYPTVLLDDSLDTPFAPQTRVMHEIGHVADNLSGPNGMYRRGFPNEDDYGASSGWQYDSDEYLSKAYKEGIASFIATSTLFHDYATEPRDCRADGTSGTERHCWEVSSSDSFDIEESHYGSCGTQEGRNPVSMERFFWDLYDEERDALEMLDISLPEMFDSVSVWPCPSYPACYALKDLSEQYASVSSDWDSVTVASGQEDYGNAWAYRNNMLNNYAGAYDAEEAYFSNCLGSWTQ